jgi:hypothetical protein
MPAVARRTVVWAVLAALGVCGLHGPARAAAAARVEVDETPLELSPPPTFLDGVLYLPLRPLAQVFGADLAVDRQAVTVRNADGAVFLVRAGRREVWSGDLVWTLAPAPARLVGGTFMVPPEMVEALFGVLAVWDERAQVLRIATPRQVRVEQADRAAPAAGPPPAPPPFTPEFTPQDVPPLVASGYVSLGVSLDAQASSAVSTVQFQSLEGEMRVDGTVIMSAHSGSLVTTGALRLRGPSFLVTAGTFTFHDSPLTLYQQQLAGVLVEGVLGTVGSAAVAGALPTGETVYGLVADLAFSAPWTAGVAVFSAPGFAASVSRLRVGRMLGDVEVFGEYAVGAALGAAGTAWRVGVGESSDRLGGTLSYLWVGPGYPVLGNASVFSGRAGPLLEVSYRPTSGVLLLGHAAVLSGANWGLPDRHAYTLRATYAPAVGSTATAEVRLVDDTAPGVWTRTITAAGSLARAWGRVGLVVGASHVLSEDRLAGSRSLSTTLAVRAGISPPSGVPTWVDVSRTFGGTENWSLALNTGVRLAAGDDLVVRARRTWSLLTAEQDTWLEVGVYRVLATGAALTVGVGVRSTTSTAPTPYLTLQYGVPVHLYGVPRAGVVDVEVFVDTDGDGLRGPAEPGVAAVVVRVDGRSAGQTNEAGRASISGVPDGDHTISLEESTIPAGLVAVSSEQRVALRPGQQAAVAFALRAAASVHGVVFVDDNHNGLLDAGEGGLQGVVVTLLPVAQVRTTGPGGAFTFDSLLPGDYRVAADPTSLPAGLAVAEPAGVPVVALPGQEASVLLAVQSATPIIKKTFP